MQALQTCQALPILINSQQETANRKQPTAPPQAITIQAPETALKPLYTWGMIYHTSPIQKSD